MDIVYNVKRELYNRGYDIKQDDITGRYYNETGHEYGFYLINSNNQWVLFFGIWLDFWKEYSKPLCITLDYGDLRLDEIKPLEDKFKKLCREKNLEIIYYGGGSVTYIKRNIIMKKNNHEQITNLIEEFCIGLEIYPFSSNRTISKLCAED
ncbi:Uncharacterised protein [uncultured archaeon]|nr:Uncharacterised protein [uncultured archaeon]